MLHKLARLAALGGALCAFQAAALGLGDINVKSKLNQPFAATIPVIGASPGELESLSVQMAGADDFTNAGIERTEYLNSLSFSVETGAGGGGAYVVVSSERRTHDPFLNFIVEARSGANRILHEYTVLLDPPEVAAAEAAAASASAPVAAPAPAPATPMPRPAPVAPAPRSAPTHEAKPAPGPIDEEAAPSGGGHYGPVSPEETLWSIATKVRPSPQVSMDQVLLALYKANPSAFEQGRFNGLRKGATLAVPSAADMQLTAPATTKAEIGRLQAGGRLTATAKPHKATSVAAESTPPAPAPTPAPAVVTEAKPQTPVAPPPPPPAIASAPSAAAPAPAAAATAATKSEGPTAQVPPPAAQPRPPPAAPTTAPNPAAIPSNAPAAAPSPESATPAAASAPTPAPAPPTATTPQPVGAAPPPPAARSSLFDDLLMPGLIVVLVLGLGLFAWQFMRRRNNAPSGFGPPGGYKPLPKGTPSPAKPTAPTIAAPPPKKPAAKPAAAAAPPKAVAPPPPSATPKPVVEPALATTALEQTAKVKPTSPAGSDVDFDLTSQFEAQTLQINLDANDPLSEAEFHLAYGLYDEAASLLKQALNKEPNRKDLRLKLAETYFAAGKPVEFQETAEGLHGQISAGEWQKIAIMGRQLCPDAALFKGEGGETPQAVDLALGDAFTPPSASAKARPADKGVIDFDLDAELLKAGAAAPASPKPGPAAKPAEAAAPAEKMDLDLSHFDLSGEHHPPAGEGVVEFNLDELDLSKPTLAAVGDEIGTKLDLARAYADMGDNEAARGLLKEVLGAGNPSQKQEAEALSKRLSA